MSNVFPLYNFISVHTPFQRLETPLYTVYVHNISKYCLTMCIRLYIGLGTDFNSDPFNITTDAGATEGRANISVTCDDEVEGMETFDMRLTLTSSSADVTLGRNTSVGEIIDSTGMYNILCNLV